VGLPSSTRAARTEIPLTVALRSFVTMGMAGLLETGSSGIVRTREGHVNVRVASCE
jgi:hypothetical protein